MPKVKWHGPGRRPINATRVEESISDGASPESCVVWGSGADRLDPAFRERCEQLVADGNVRFRGLSVDPQTGELYDRDDRIVGRMSARLAGMEYRDGKLYDDRGIECGTVE